MKVKVLNGDAFPSDKIQDGSELDLPEVVANKLLKRKLVAKLDDVKEKPKAKAKPKSNKKVKS